MIKTDTHEVFLEHLLTGSNDAIGAYSSRAPGISSFKYVEPRPDQQLHFGQEIDGLPELIICVGLLRLEPYRYHNISNSYNRLYNPNFWSIHTDDCINKEEAGHLYLAGKMTLEDYVDSGYGSFGYAGFVSEHAQMAELLDNPGLLTLVIDSVNRTSPHDLRMKSRVDLLSNITGLTGLSRRHIKWLSRVRPAKHHPSLLAPLIRQALLEYPNSDLENGKLEDAKLHQLDKLRAHQSTWSLDGLRYLAAIIETRHITDRQNVHRLTTFNNDASATIEIRRHIERLLLHRDLPRFVRDRASMFLELSSKLPPEVRFKVMSLETFPKVPLDEALNADLLLPFITREDVLRPSLTPAGPVTHLDTPEAIKIHAHQQGHCLWSANYLGGVLDKIVELYAYDVDGCHVTIAISTQTLGIMELQARGQKFTVQDYLNILEWQFEAIGNKRSLKEIPCPAYMKKSRL